MTLLKKVHENDFEWRNGDSGVKYLMRGLILLKPGEMMGSKAHGHNIIDETFYFMYGNGLMIIDGTDYPAPQGSVFLCEPKEMHNIRNDSDKEITIIFIKGEYKPDDKIDSN